MSDDRRRAGRGGEHGPRRGGDPRQAGRTDGGPRRGRRPDGDRRPDRSADGGGNVDGGSGARRPQRADRTPDRRPQRQSAAVSPARRVALDVLRRVRADDAYANLLLPARIREAQLSPRDAALATELAYGTLRGLGTYDAVIALAADRPVDAIDAPVLDVLRLATHQLLSMRTPGHAAVHEAVEQARLVAGPRATAFSNAVLRRVSDTTRDEWFERVLATRSGDDALAVRWSHPVWIVRALRTALGADPATAVLGAAVDDDLEQLLAVDQHAPAVALAALPGMDGDADVALEPKPYAPTARLAPPGDPAGLVGVRTGALRVQDEGSQLAALALSRARPIAAGERWLDLAAGPGGKAALLAAEAAAGGAVLVANEVSPARAGLVERALAPVPGRHEVVVGDGRTIGDAQPGAFDRILLDAPCTGIGALRRRPEARWRKRPTDVPSLTLLQEQLLESAVAALAPGGLLAYVTCSPHVAETRQQLSRLLRAHPQLRAVDTGAVLSRVCREPLPGVAAGQHAVQLWPHRHGTDAMFIALVEKQ